MTDSFKDKKKHRIWRLVLFVLLIILDNLDALYLHTLGIVRAFIELFVDMLGKYNFVDMLEKYTIYSILGMLASVGVIIFVFTIGLPMIYFISLALRGNHEKN